MLWQQLNLLGHMEQFKVLVNETGCQWVLLLRLVGFEKARFWSIFYQIFVNEIEDGIWVSDQALWQEFVDTLMV
jgi:hypothetical protein